MLRDADATVVEQAVAATAELPDPQACVDPATLLAEDAPTQDPELAAAASDIEGQLAQGRALELAGQYDRALGPVLAARQRAQTLGLPRLEAAALLRLGLLQEHTGGGAHAADNLAAAYFTAEAAHHRATRAEAAVHLVHVTGGPPRGREEDALWARLAGSIAAGLGDGALDLRGSLLQHRSRAGGAGRRCSGPRAVARGNPVLFAAGRGVARVRDPLLAPRVAPGVARAVARGARGTGGPALLGSSSCCSRRPGVARRAGCCSRPWLGERAASSGRGVAWVHELLLVATRRCSTRAVARARPRCCASGGSGERAASAGRCSGSQAAAPRGLLLAPGRGVARAAPGSARQWRGRGVARAVAPGSARHRRAAALLGSASCCSRPRWIGKCAPSAGRCCSGPRAVARDAGCCSRPITVWGDFPATRRCSPRGLMLAPLASVAR